jgi:hypothetical protein
MFDYDAERSIKLPGELRRKLAAIEGIDADPPT